MKSDETLAHRPGRAAWRTIGTSILTLCMACALTQCQPPEEPDAPEAEEPATDTAQLLDELREAVRQQEDRVEESRKALAAIARARGIIETDEGSFYRFQDLDDSAEGRISTVSPIDSIEGEKESHEQAIQRGLDAQEFIEAKKAFEVELALLQQMRLKLIGETITAGMPETNSDHPDPADPAADGP